MKRELRKRERQRENRRLKRRHKKSCAAPCWSFVGFSISIFIITA